MNFPQVNIQYELSFAHRNCHLVDVVLKVTGAAPFQEPVQLSMAAWCPGSYLIRDYARFVSNVRALGPNEQVLPVHKTAKHSWQIDTYNCHSFAVHYQVYGHELSVRTNHIDSTHAFLHGPATYLTVDRAQGTPCEVVIQEPFDRVVTGLPGQQESFLAANVDVLLDTPIHVGECIYREFVAAGKPARLAIWGTIDSYTVATVDRLLEDLTVVMDTQANRFGEVPYDDYTFLLMLSPGAYGGLEHRNSSANLNNPWCLSSDKSYMELLELLSHEYFHAWNGKRMFPATFKQFDYQQENYTRCLWMVEGITSYYDRFALRQAKILSVEQYFEKVLTDWTRLQGTPGRYGQSLEESSFDAWIKLYKPNEFNINTTVSYYLKGSLVALVLDLHIRIETGGKYSLEHFLRTLWEEFGTAQQPYPEDVEPLLSSACGVDASQIFSECIRGRTDPALEEMFAGIGLCLRPIADSKQSLWLGVQCQSGTLVVASVLDGSPGMGTIAPGDELIAVDDFRIRSQRDLRERLTTRSYARDVNIAAWRRGRLVSFAVKAQESPPKGFEIIGTADVTAAQKNLYEGWSGEPHPGEQLIAKANTKRWI